MSVHVCNDECPFVGQLFPRTTEVTFEEVDAAEFFEGDDVEGPIQITHVHIDCGVHPHEQDGPGQKIHLTWVNENGVQWAAHLIAASEVETEGALAFAVQKATEFVRGADKVRLFEKPSVN